MRIYKAETALREVINELLDRGGGLVPNLVANSNEAFVVTVSGYEPPRLIATIRFTPDIPDEVGLAAYVIEWADEKAGAM